MSYDLCLLKLPPEATFEDAVERMDELSSDDVADPIHHESDTLARFLMDLEPRYKPFEKDYEQIAEFEKITVGEARKRYNWIELNGQADGKPMAQFIICYDHVDVHWYSGTSEEELNRYVHALCTKAGYALVDPQSATVTRFDAPAQSE